MYSAVAGSESRLLSRELGHRVKNILAVVQSLALQSDTRGHSVESFRAASLARLQRTSACGLTFRTSGHFQVNIRIIDVMELWLGLEAAGRLAYDQGWRGLAERATSRPAWSRAAANSSPVGNRVDFEPVLGDVDARPLSRAYGAVVRV